MYCNPKTWKITKTVQERFILPSWKRHTSIFSDTRLLIITALSRMSVCWGDGRFFVGFSTFIGYAICSSALAIHFLHRWHLSLSVSAQNWQNCDNDRILCLLSRIEHRIEDWKKWHFLCCQSFAFLSQAKTCMYFRIDESLAYKTCYFCILKILSRHLLIPTLQLEPSFMP